MLTTQSWLRTLLDGCLRGRTRKLAVKSHDKPAMFRKETPHDRLFSAQSQAAIRMLEFCRQAECSKVDSRLTGRMVPASSRRLLDFSTSRMTCGPWIRGPVFASFASLLNAHLPRDVANVASRSKIMQECHRATDVARTKQQWIDLRFCKPSVPDWAKASVVSLITCRLWRASSTSSPSQKM